MGSHPGFSGKKALQRCIPDANTGEQAGIRPYSGVCATIRHSASLSRSAVFRIYLVKSFALGSAGRVSHNSHPPHLTDHSRVVGPGRRFPRGMIFSLISKFFTAYTSAFHGHGQSGEGTLTCHFSVPRGSGPCVISLHFPSFISQHWRNLSERSELKRAS